MSSNENTLTHSCINQPCTIETGNEKSKRRVEYISSLLLTVAKHPKRCCGRKGSFKCSSALDKDFSFCGSNETVALCSPPQQTLPAQRMMEDCYGHLWQLSWLSYTVLVHWWEWNYLIIVGVFLGLYNDMIILFSHNDDNDHYYGRGVGGEETARNGDFAA